MVGAEADDDDLVRAGKNETDVPQRQRPAHDMIPDLDRIIHARVLQRPFDDADHIIRPHEAQQHRQKKRDDAFDHHPAEIFEVFEKAFNWTALVLRPVWRRFLGKISHEESALELAWRDYMTLVSGGGGLDCAWAAVLAGGVLGVVVCADSFSIESVTSREAFLNSLMPLPRPFANSGIFFAPNNTSTATRTMINSVPPNPNKAKNAFISFRF